MLNQDEKKVYNVGDLMNILSLSRTSVYKLIEKNYFPVIKLERAIRIPKTSFEDWFKNGIK